MRCRSSNLLAACALGAMSSAVFGQYEEELAKKLSNPVASLISVPFQSNFDFNLGPEDGFRYTMNVQPVIPISLNDQWNLIIQAETTYDWNADAWTIPIGLFASQVVKIGDQSMSLAAGPRYYADAPDGGPDWCFRVVLTLIFPK